MPVTELSRVENTQLDFHVNEIRAALFRFGLTAGEHLSHIHSKRLYRSHGSFDEFVWDTFHFHAKRAYQFIKAYKVLSILQEAGVQELPDKEFHCRPLYRLIDRPGELVKAWNGKKSTIVESGQPYTAVEVDCFPTPVQVVRDLFDREKFSGSIWDCAAGDGRIVKVAREYYPNAELLGTDISTGTDFLEVTPWTHVDNIVTNPPYVFKDEFVLRSMDIRRRSIAMLLPLHFLSGQERYRTILCGGAFKLVTVWIYVSRIEFLNGQRPDFQLAWFIWRKRTNTQHPVIRWIE